jgi:hypothetical protein
LDYTELSNLDFDETNEICRSALKKGHKRKNLTAFIGYPGDDRKFHSTKNYLKTIGKLQRYFYLL